MLSNLRNRLFADHSRHDAPELIEREDEDAPLSNSALPPLTASSVLASSRSLYRNVPPEDALTFVDTRFYTAMVSAESVLDRSGDIYDAMASRLDYYSEGLVITHPDKKIEAVYREWAENVQLDYWLADSHLTSMIYGQSYPVFYGSGQDSRPFCISPKSVAVGSGVVAGQRPTVYIGNNANGLYQNMIVNNLGVVYDNEWPIDLPKGNNKTVLALSPDRVYHRSEPKPSFKRYAIPPVIRAWDDITQRIILGEMIKDTVSALKTQIRVWSIENPMQGEVRKLAASVRSMKEARVYDLIWRGGLKVESVVPGTVSELLADRTWMSMTDRVFRSVGLPLVLATGELMSGNTTSTGGSDWERQVLTAVTRLEADMNENIRIARWMFAMFRDTGRDAALKRAPLPSVQYREIMLTQEGKVRSIVPLLNYGAISIRSTQERVGIDPEIELARLREELPMRGREIQPYAGFGQLSSGREVQSPSSPGRPLGPDTDTEHAATNRENARAGRNGRV